MSPSADDLDRHDNGTPSAIPDLRSEPLAIVGIGASAGGLKALAALLSAVPARSRLAIVVIQHRIPNNERLLADLLAKATPLSVLTAEDGIALEPDRIYIAPAGRLPTMEGGRLRIREPQLPADAALPIDIFFRTLATDQQEKAICVVLSGTGSDGTNGLRSIKECGGLVVVQDPVTAAFDGMPNSAIATGMADYVLAPESIPGALVAFVRQPYLGVTAARESEADAPPDTALDGILDRLAAQTKRDHRAYKTKSLTRRIERRMGIQHITGMPDYLAFLDANPAEIDLLSRDILISVTRFFRDGPAFEVLAKDFIGPLSRNRPVGRPVRAWIPACASGEEAYSIAMLLMEACAQSESSFDIRVFGSDVDSRALNVARAGVYPETIAVDVSPERLARFFTRVEGGGYKVAKALREAVTFAQHNLLNDPPFSNLDLVSCRNVLIYIEPAVQKTIFAMFHFALAPNGGLFLGTAETVDARSDLFAPLSKKWRLYQRVGQTRGSAIRVPAAGGEAAATAPAPLASLRGTSPADIIRQALLLEYAPAAVLIDGLHRVQYLFGPTGDFLDLPTGEPPWDLTAMTRGELRLKLRAAIAQALASHDRVQVAGIRHKRHGTAVPVTILVIPVRFPRGRDDLLLVTFTFGDVAAAPAAMAAPMLTDTAGTDQLEYELRLTREELNDTIEELGATTETLRIANEEILSIGEEYQSTNEELETSKEELQSLNEELSTLNAQLHEKVDELEVTTNDLTNLLSSTDIATVFLSPDLRIKRFTPTATRLFALLPQDAGRPITDISRRFADPELVADTLSVLESLAPSEREVTVDEDSTFLRRIQPYRTQDGRVEGTVITFSDVTLMKRTSLALALRARQHKLIADLGHYDLTGEDGPETLTEAAHLIAEGLGADGVAILGPAAGPPDHRIGDAEGLTLLGSVGFSLLQGGAVTFPADMATLVGRVYRSRQPLIVENFATDQRVRAALPLPGGRAASGLGVAFGDSPRGPSVLAVFSHAPERFSAADLEFVQAIASVLGLVIERAGTLRMARADRDFAQAIVDTVREPLLVLDETLRVVGASAAFHRVFGTTAGSTLGHPLSETAGGLLADPALRRSLERIIPEDTVIDALEIVFNPTAAETPAERRTLLLNARRLNQAGQLILLAMEDVTQQARVREALAAAKATAEQASASKTRFLAAASHDLRQPVQALVMFQHLLTLQPQGDAASKLLVSLGNALGALTAMLDDILDVSRLDAGIIEVAPRPCLVQTMITSLCAEVTPLAEAAGLSLRCMPTSRVVRSDPKLLVRILRNFIANAVKYTDEGRILVGCRRSGRNLRIQVWDTGCGIAENQLTAIFEEFHQVGNPERDRRQGLGLGLAIVERLAALLHHTIQVRSTLGKGSVFEILVPLACPDDPIPEEEGTALFDGGDGERMLVIDDDPAVLDGVGSFLQEQGYDVVAAPDGDIALERLKNRSPHLVIADFRLKGAENGSDLIRRLERHFGAPLLGILLTGDTSPERIREAADSGFLLLHKPLSPQDLLAAIQRVLADRPSSPGLA